MNTTKTKAIAEWVVAVGCAVLIAALVLFWLDLRDTHLAVHDGTTLVTAQKSSIPIPASVPPLDTNGGPTESVLNSADAGVASKPDPTKRLVDVPTKRRVSSSLPSGSNADGKAVADPLARVALASVGDDFVATAYWLGAINDPSVPAEERKDLIEDLNEDGFVDPRHPSPAELPLILSRLALIEEIAADAMDGTNAAAFAEAYKDLLGMARGRLPD